MATRRRVFCGALLLVSLSGCFGVMIQEHRFNAAREAYEVPMGAVLLPFAASLDALALVAIAVLSLGQGEGPSWLLTPYTLTLLNPICNAELDPPSEVPFLEEGVLVERARRAGVLHADPRVVEDLLAPLTRWRKQGAHLARLRFELQELAGGRLEVTLVLELAGAAQELVSADEEARLRRAIVDDWNLRCRPPLFDAQAYQAMRYAQYRRQGWPEATAHRNTERDLERKLREVGPQVLAEIPPEKLEDEVFGARLARTRELLQAAPDALLHEAWEDLSTACGAASRQDLGRHW